jgi:small subunit ribosomal protein S3
VGQKVNPIGLRLGISKTWNSKWFAEKDYASQLKQDLDIQKFVKARLKHAAISKIEVERTAKKNKSKYFLSAPRNNHR